jgi:hypothetical protein
VQIEAAMASSCFCGRRWKQVLTSRAHSSGTEREREAGLDGREREREERRRRWVGRPAAKGRLGEDAERACSLGRERREQGVELGQAHARKEGRMSVWARAWERKKERKRCGLKRKEVFGPNRK